MTTKNPQINWSLLAGSLTLFLAVILGAFAAHGLEKVLELKALRTFYTGVNYQIYHGLGLLGVGLLQNQIPSLNVRPVQFLFGLGLVFFSGFCYLYALTQIKVLALLVPIGGTSFLIGWGHLFLVLWKERRKA